MRPLTVVFLALAALGISGCASTTQRAMDSGNQLQLRSMQTRVFDSADRVAVLRTVVATLQDLGFVIDQADSDLGTVSATKLNQYLIKMTVTVHARNATSVSVRASARYNLQPIEDPAIYQDFFTALEKSMFLKAQQVE